MQPVRVGFLGFGEAAYHFARGLTQNGLGGIAAYSRSGAKAASGDPLRQRAAEAGVELVATPRELCERTDLIFGWTPRLAALLIKALEAARRHGILDAVAGSMAASMDERPFSQIITRFVCGTAVHAERRVHEMSEALALLRSLGSSSRMTCATPSKLVETSERGLRERFGGREPDGIHPVIEAIVAAGA